VAISHDGAVLLRRRPPKGLLGGMHEPPTSTWEEGFPASAAKLAPVKGAFRKLPGLVRHGFTHFALELEVYRADGVARKTAPRGSEWAPLRELERFALPTVMKKVIAHAVGARHAGPLFGR
jgi:A/G-specific adenine glycosylase